MIPSKKTPPKANSHPSDGSRFHLNGPFSGRRATFNDLAACWDINAQYTDEYLDDFQTQSPEWIAGLIESGDFYCFEYDDGRKKELAAIVWLNEVRPPVSVELHFLLYPKWLRKALQYELMEVGIQFIFDTYGIYKINACCMHTQSSARQYLSRLGFQEKARLENNTLKQGQWVDHILFELTKPQWEEFRMSTGKKSNDGKVKDALKPKSFYTPFGNLSNGTYTPNESADQVATRTGVDSKIRNIVDGMPTQYDVNAAYNNPFYNTMLGLTRQPIDMQRAQDTKELNNSLSARNQLGSSYDAYSRYLIDQRYDQSYRQAENQARLSSADAYNQSFQNSLNALHGLRNDQVNYMNTLYRPAELALGYQQAVSPLQQTLANYYKDTYMQEASFRNQIIGSYIGRPSVSVGPSGVSMQPYQVH